MRCGPMLATWHALASFRAAGRARRGTQQTFWRGWLQGGGRTSLTMMWCNSSSTRTSWSSRGRSYPPRAGLRRVATSPVDRIHHLDGRDGALAEAFRSTSCSSSGRPAAESSHESSIWGHMRTLYHIERAHRTTFVTGLLGGPAALVRATHARRSCVHLLHCQMRQAEIKNTKRICLTLSQTTRLGGASSLPARLPEALGLVLWKGSSLQLVFSLAAGGRCTKRRRASGLCWACGLPSPLPSAHALCLRCLCLRTPLEPLPPICWQVQLTVRLVRAPAVWDVLWCMPHLTARRSPTRTNSSAAPPYWRAAEAVASPSMAL